MAGNPGGAVWYGSDLHGIESFDDLSVETVRQAAARNWLEPERYLAILMNDDRYDALRNTNIDDDAGYVMRGSIHLRGLYDTDHPTDHVTDWTMLEQSPVLIGGYGYMMMQRWGNLISQTEKRRYRLLTEVGSAIVHYLPLNKAEKKLVTLKASLDGLDGAVDKLKKTYGAGKKGISRKIKDFFKKRGGRTSNNT